MLLIIDVNCISKVLCDAPSQDFLPILNSLMEGKRRIVIGGKKLENELKKVSSVLVFLKNLDQAGRVLVLLDNRVDLEEKYVENSFNIKSDDPHILALARVSGARLLCSFDKFLHKDFCNKSILDKPRGRVYQSVKHEKLLRTVRDANGLP